MRDEVVGAVDIEPRVDTVNVVDMEALIPILHRNTDRLRTISHMVNTLSQVIDGYNAPNDTNNNVEACSMKDEIIQQYMLTDNIIDMLSHVFGTMGLT